MQRCATQVAAKEIMTEIARKWKEKSEDKKARWQAKLEAQKELYRQQMATMPPDERCVVG